MQKDAILVQLGYVSNEALLKQIERIQENTVGYEKIIKHIMELHEHLKVDESYVAMSNTEDFFKIKVEAPSSERIEEAHEKIQHFCEKYKVKIEKLEDKDTYYIKGFNN